MVRQGLTQLFHRLNLAADVLAVICALIGAYVLRFSGWPIAVLHEPPALRLYLQALPVVAAVVLVCFQYAGLYLQRRGISGVDELGGIVKATTAAFLIILGVTFFYRSESYSRVVVFYAWGFTIILALLFRTILRRIQVGLRRRGVGVSRLALVGLTEIASLVAEHVRRYPGLGYKLIGYVSEQATTEKAWHGARVLGEAAGLSAIIRQEEIDEVIVALPAGAHALLENLLIEAEATGVRFKIVSDLFGIITNPMSVDEIYGIPVFALKESPLTRMTARTFKRALDLACAVPALILLLPLWLVLAALIKGSSPGPVFFRQERVGRDNRSFMVFKFRTMRQDAEADTGPVWAQKDDPRRTAVGAWLRRTSLDELPQLLNVLRGDMSLVGPRPERPHFVNQFKDTIPRYLERHRVKSGLTGWAQVHGLRGNTPIADRTQYDLWYVENWSLALDIKILLRTALEVFHHKEAY
jgi:exopolysaccharide biosynthesis polyprenyl glycosylphosphotransferase